MLKTNIYFRWGPRPQKSLRASHRFERSGFCISGSDLKRKAESATESSGVSVQTQVWKFVDSVLFHEITVAICAVKRSLKANLYIVHYLVTCGKTLYVFETTTQMRKIINQTKK